MSPAIRLWTLLGESQTGKSRVVGDLSSRPGRGRAGFSYILLRGGGYLSVYSKKMAWQEDRKPPAESVAEIKSKVSTLTRALRGPPSVVNVLSTLRYDPVTHWDGLFCPSANLYLNAWIAEGWELASLVLMSPDREGSRDFYGRYGAPTAWIYESRALAAGEMVGTVRNHFSWA